MELHFFRLNSGQNHFLAYFNSFSNNFLCSYFSSFRKVYTNSARIQELLGIKNMKLNESASFVNLSCRYPVPSFQHQFSYSVFFSCDYAAHILSSCYYYPCFQWIKKRQIPYFLIELLQ